MRPHLIADDDHGDGERERENVWKDHLLLLLLSVLRTLRGSQLLPDAFHPGTELTAAGTYNKRLLGSSFTLRFCGYRHTNVGGRHSTEVAFTPLTKPG